MSISRAVVFCFCLLVEVCNTLFAQGTKSPYSSFGIGESYGSSLVHNQGMGGLGISQPQFWYINNQNPALLAYNSFTVFSLGLVGEQRQISSETDSELSKGGNLSYLAIAFPIKYAKISTSIGLMPYTNVNYKIIYDEQIVGTQDTATVAEAGNSGITQLYWSTGVKVHKDVAIGIKVSYLFGSINNVYEAAIDDNEQPVPFISGISENTYARGLNLGLGFSYSKDSLFNKNYRFSVGTVYDLKGSINGDLETELYKISLFTSDTLQSTQLNSQSGKLKLPASLGIGVSFGRDRKWNVGIDYQQQNWSNFRSLNEDERGLGASRRWTAGGEFTPDYISLSYLKRVTYRAGLSYEQLPFVTDGNKVIDFGYNFGLSLPAGRSSIDLAIKSGNRGTINDNGLREKYFKIYLGITLNDQWFIKRKFD
jgi:long-subunit fatty acid transport protein